MCCKDIGIGKSDSIPFLLLDRTLDIVFSRFWEFSFTISLWSKPKGVTRYCERKTPKN